MLGLEIQNIRMILHENAQNSLAWATIWATVKNLLFYPFDVSATGSFRKSSFPESHAGFSRQLRNMHLGELKEV
jgi:hypothetical protein